MPNRLKLFFTYYGGKWRIAKHYPSPKYSTIIEPFAGSAGYSLHYHDLNVRLYDIDPIICGIWDYLIKASSSDILQLPLNIKHIDEANVCQEAKWLIGFWLNKACSQPAKQPSLWMRQGLRPNSFWSAAIRDRIASQIDSIKHWKIEQKSYKEIENIEATWYIDPPYYRSGKLYKFNLIDYKDLGEWSMARNGQIMVCEQDGADWLPFVPFREIKTTEGAHGKAKGKEVVWIQDVI